MVASIASGAQFILQNAGWLELGRCVSVTKLRRDSEATAKILPALRASIGHPQLVIRNRARYPKKNRVCLR
jgi:trimethylamine:corrinoid methyltransferase-like protein